MRAARLPPLLTLLAAALAILAAWWWPNRPQLAHLSMPAGKLRSVSFAPYRADESPLANRFPTRAEVDQDLALIARRSRAIRTYAAIEGDYDLPALARAHGLKIWQGIWLGADRAGNRREIAAGIALANKYPDVIERVVVGNEVLLRKDLPADELIADIDEVRHAIRQQVTYADVFNFFFDHPEVVAHLDVATIHILPYWEDHPTDIAGAIAHVGAELAEFRRRFPAAAVAVGETGWPSRGRWRQDAVPGLVNQVRFLREFTRLAELNHIDYNFFASFDQVWKYRNEGVVGASWGLWTVDRRPKFPLDGPVREDPAWPVPAALSIACGLLLYALSARTPLSLTPPSLTPPSLTPPSLTPPSLSPRASCLLAAACMALGAALGFAWHGTDHLLLDRFVTIAAIGNLAGQSILAFLFARRLPVLLSGTPPSRTPPARTGLPPPRTGTHATEAIRTLLRPAWPAAWRGPSAPHAVFEDLLFLFAWTACVLQLLLLYDPRYRDFPLPTFAVPALVTALRWPAHDHARRARPEWIVGLTLAAAALAGSVQEGPLNLQSLAWCAMALLLAAGLLWRPPARPPSTPA